MRYVGKHCSAEEITYENNTMAHLLCMLGNLDYRHVFGLCSTYCFSKATAVT
jgi:hypothetical protein